MQKQLTMTRLVGLVAAALAVLVVIVCVPLATSTMRAPGVDSGTIFASSSSWTYSSSFDANDTSSYYDGASSEADIRAGAEASIHDWLADVDRGAAAFDYCDERHSDRRVMLISLGVAAVVLAGVTAIMWWRDRSRRPGPRVGLTDR